MKSNGKFLAPLVLLAIVVGGVIIWPRLQNHAQLVEAADSKHIERVAEDASQNTASPPVLTAAKHGGDGTPHVVANHMNSLSSRQLYADTAMSLGDRFTGLVARAGGGDETAEHFALQIANQCNSISQVPLDQPPDGHAHATQYQVQLRRQMQSECAAVLAAPGFAELQDTLKMHAVDALDSSVKSPIRHQFADQGAEAALDAAVIAIMARPNETTAMVVADQIADFDISSVYMQPKFQSLSSINPQQRNMLMRYSLGLLACDYGRPCGPNSFAVRSTCLGLGACMLGADLQRVYEQQLLTGQQVQDLRALLAYLQQIRATMVAHWR